MTTPGIPGMRLPKPAQEVVARPRANSHGDSEAPVEVEDDRPSTVEFDRAVHAKYGKGSFSGPAWVFLVIALMGGCVATTWFVTRGAASGTSPDEVLIAVKALKAEVDKGNAAKELHDALVLQRIGMLETQNGATQARLDAILRQTPAYAPPVNVPVSQALAR